MRPDSYLQKLALYKSLTYLLIAYLHTYLLVKYQIKYQLLILLTRRLKAHMKTLCDSDVQ